MAPTRSTRARLGLVAVLTSLVSSGLFSAAAPAGACADEHIGFQWMLLTAPLRDGTHPEAYWTVEGSSVSLTIRGIETGPGCTQSNVAGNATYSVEEYPAGTPRKATVEDFVAQSATTTAMSDHRGPGPEQYSFPVATLPGPAVPAEPVAEKARALITGGGQLMSPHDLPVYIIDDDGVSRASMERSVYPDMRETDVASVVVFRGGPADAAHTVTYTVAGSSSKPAVAGKDFKTPSGSVTFAPTERVKIIEIQMINDTRVEPAEELTVTLSGPPLVEEPVSTRIQLLDNDSDAIKPATRFHHPRHRTTYKRGDYRLREFHIFATDRGGAGVIRVQIALRRHRTNGRCQWLRGARTWVSGGCGTKRWVKAAYDPALDWYYYRLDALGPSTGSSTRSYSAYARGLDGAGNLETKMIATKNSNTFEVRR